jgi:hypothetical protein
VGLEDGKATHVLNPMILATAIFPILMTLIRITLILLCLGIFPFKDFQTAAWVPVAFIAMKFFVICPYTPVQYSTDKDDKPEYHIPGL